MKKLFVFLMVAGLVIGSLSLAQAAVWYDITFTGADIWTYSADNAAQSRTNQDAPRRYRDWTVTGDPVQATTYGYPASGDATGFGAWAPNSGFAFDSINLWGAGGTGDWNETFVSVGNSDPGAEGVSSWRLIQKPATWSQGIVEGNDPWSADATHAFPVWRSSGTSDMLGISNMLDPSFVFEFQVLADPAVLDSNGKLRVFFGGFRDDLQGTGPDNYEVSGVMTLRANAVPEPATMLLLGLGLIGLAGVRRKFKQ